MIQTYIITITDIINTSVSSDESDNESIINENIIETLSSESDSIDFNHSPIKNHNYTKKDCQMISSSIQINKFQNNDNSINLPLFPLNNLSLYNILNVENEN